MPAPLPRFQAGQPISARSLQALADHVRSIERRLPSGSANARLGSWRAAVREAMPFTCSLAAKSPEKKGGKEEMYLEVTAGTVTIDAGGFAEIPEKKLESPHPVKVEAEGYVWLTLTRKADGSLTYQYEVAPDRPGEARSVTEKEETKKS